MKIAARELKPFADWVFKMTDNGTIEPIHEDDFVAWGIKALASPKEPVLDTDPLDMPPQFGGLYHKFQSSKDYQLDADSLEHQARERRTDSTFIVRTQPVTAAKRMNANFAEEFDRLTGPTRARFGDIETARRNGTYDEIGRTLGVARRALRQEVRASGGDPVTKILEDPEARERWEDLAAQRGMFAIGKTFSPGIYPTDTAIGSAAVAAARVFGEILYASYDYSAYRDLGCKLMLGAKMNYANLTAVDAAYWLTPSMQGQTLLPPQAVLAGNMVSALANTIALRVDASLELIQDSKTVVVDALLRALSEGHAAAVDYASFQGNGNNDSTNGSQIGIFSDPNIATVASGAGNTSVATLQREDFLACIAAASPAAYTKDPRFYVSSAFLPKLMKLKDGTGPKYLLRTPAETEAGYLLCGFPCTFSIQAPANDLPGQKVVAFGAPNGYLVALQEEMEILASDVVGMAQNLRQFRLINRGLVETRMANWFATLTLAAK
jgi:hypothetical protein